MSAAARIISTTILALWMVPLVGSVGIGLHLADHHDAAAAHEHGEAISDLARAATHGHHHEAGAAPDHEHAATLLGPAFLVSPSVPSVIALPAVRVFAADLTPRSLSEAAPRRGPPIPLFTTHCSLLI